MKRGKDSGVQKDLLLSKTSKTTRCHLLVLTASTIPENTAFEIGPSVL